MVSEMVQEMVPDVVREMVREMVPEMVQEEMLAGTGRSRRAPRSSPLAVGTPAPSRLRVKRLNRCDAVECEALDRLRVVGGVPREQKMLKGHLPRVIYHQEY